MSPLIQSKKINMMDRRLPDNPRYAKVKSKIDTGNTIKKIKLISSKEFLKRLDEPFFRLTPKCLMELLKEYEPTLSTEGTKMPEMIAKMVKNEKGDYVLHRHPVDDEETTGNNDDAYETHSTGGPKIVSYTEDEKIEYDIPYLLLDVREAEEFSKNRITRSLNYPLSFVNRDKILPEILNYKHKDNTLIIVYDSDERTARAVGTTMVHRGFDNIYLLTGGINAVAGLFPECIEGICPTTARPNTESTKSTRSSAIVRQRCFTAKSGTSQHHSIFSKAKSKKKDSMSDVESMASNLSIAESVISRAAVRKTQYAANNIR